MKISRRKFTQLSAFTGMALMTDSVLLNPFRTAANFVETKAEIEQTKTTDDIIAVLRRGWNNPSPTYRPHTRWWWPGNAVTREGIDWQLEQMKEQGLGGIEIMSFFWNYAASLDHPTPIPSELQDHYGATWDEKYKAWNGLQSMKQNNKINRLPSGLVGPVKIYLYERR